MSDKRIIIAHVSGIGAVTAALVEALKSGDLIGDADILVVDDGELHAHQPHPLPPREITYSPPSPSERGMVERYPRYERQAPRPRDQYSMKTKGRKRP